MPLLSLASHDYETTLQNTPVLKVRKARLSSMHDEKCNQYRKKMSCIDLPFRYPRS